MIRNLSEAEFLPRLGLAVGIYILWAAFFLSLAAFENGGVKVLVAIPVLLSAILFGMRGAVLGTMVGIVGHFGLHAIAGTGSFGDFIQDGNLINGAVLLSIALMVGYFNRYKSDGASEVVQKSVDTLRGQERNLLREQLNTISMEFNASAHRKLVITEVTRCAATHISRALRPDFLAIAVADLENRKITVEQAIGVRMLGFTYGDVRSVSEALNDSLSAGELIAVNHEELVELTGTSHVAAATLEAGLRSALIANFRKDDGDLVAQIWIGSAGQAQYSDLEVGFIAQMAGHFKSAVENARNSESLKQLQRHLVAQNELLAQMQDGVEGAEGELRLSNNQLTHLNESKTQFMSEVAHEIKSPLAVMIGYADILRFDTEHMGSDQRKYAASIEGSARQLEVLIDDLSDITNMESGHFNTVKKPHDVMKVVKSVVEGLKVSNPKFEMRIQLSDFITDFEVDGDPARLSQVFTNLISNALKYSSEDQFVEISARKAAGKLRIAIIDRGLGISDSDLEQLFTPYFRSMNTEVRHRPGTGLGLFLSKSLVEEHGGSLTVSSKVGVGSTFTVELSPSSNSAIASAA